MNPRSIAPALRAILVVAAAALSACSGPGSTNPDLTGATGVPVGTVVPGGNANGNAVVAGGNGLVPSAGQEGGAPNANGPATPATKVIGALTVSPYNAESTLCMATATATPVSGMGVVIASCNGAANQQWRYEAGRLRTDPNLCLTNLGANSTPTAVATPNDLLAVVTTCDANDTRQHVEPASGALQNSTGPNLFALSLLGTPLAQGAFFWASFDPNDGRQAYALGAQGQGSAAQGFAVRVSGTSTCLDANAGTAVGGGTGAALCDATRPSQAWQMGVHGQLVNAGRCLDGSTPTTSLPSCGTLTTAQQWLMNYGSLVGPTTCLSPSATGVALSACTASSARYVLGGLP